MTPNDEENLSSAIESLIEALDSAPMVCFMPSVPEVIYGPFTPEEAMNFCATWNSVFADMGIPGNWVAKPLLKPLTNPV